MWEEEVKRRRKAVGGREGLGGKGVWQGEIEAVREGREEGREVREEERGERGEGRGGTLVAVSRRSDHLTCACVSVSLDACVSVCYCCVSVCCCIVCVLIMCAPQ